MSLQESDKHKQNNSNTEEKSEETKIEDLIELLLELKVQENKDYSKEKVYSNKEIESIQNLQNLLTGQVEEDKKNNFSVEQKKQHFQENILDSRSISANLAKIPSNNEKHKKQEKLNNFQIELNSEKEYRQNLNSVDWQKQLDNLKRKINSLETQLNESKKSIEPLIPLITELLTIKLFDLSGSQEATIEALVPVIDRIIQKRAIQDIQGISNVLANILPIAIAQEIKDSPEQIAKAIAPEIALAIQEQIRLDRDSMSKTLGPEMGNAIKEQIHLERDAMVDALYPVIGSTISKYMGEVVNQINQRVETALSTEGFKRKIRAKLQGVSEAELIFRESIRFTVQAIFLIQKNTGLVIREVQTESEHKLDSNMLAGMLTAIRSFANECIVREGETSELNQIEYSDSKIILEVAGYCYLAVVVKGEPSKLYIDKIRETLSQIILNYDREIKEFDGDPRTVPETLQLSLENLIATEEKGTYTRSPTTLLVVLAVLLGLILLPWGFVQYRSSIARQIETKIATDLDAAPELSVYRIVPKLHRGIITLTGRVKDRSLREKAAEIASASAPKLEINNKIIAVEVPPTPESTAAEIARLTAVFNRQAKVAISSRYQANTVTVEGIVLDPAQIDKINWGLAQIPGVRSVISRIETGIPALDLRIYFELNSTEISKEERSGKIRKIEQFLSQYSELNLKIIGYSDVSGTLSRKKELAIGRAQSVKQLLVSAGVDPARLETSSSLTLPPNINRSQPLWLSRCVRFEPFIPPVKNN